MKETAESYLGESVKRAVVTVPAYFTDSQRQATKDAGKIAGLTVERVINEPTAAALAYGLDKSEGKEKKIVVFDLGGGTFDVSILEMAEGVFEVKSTNGDTFLGGEDFDVEIVKYIANEFKKKNGIDLMKDTLALQRLKDAAESAKIELSTASSTDINQPFIANNPSGGAPLHLNMKMSRAKLEGLVEHLIRRTRGPCEQCMKDSGLEKNEISTVLLVGGMTRMPKVQAFVKQFFGKEPSKGVNPDEVVAMGAAIQGGIMMGHVEGVVLLDVTPLTLGIETMGGVSSSIIDKNTTIPTKKEKIFSTASDNQVQVNIKVLQGERPMSLDNKCLGEFTLEGLAPAPRGVPQIEVSFDIDANGIVAVTAKDKRTGREQQITVQSDGGLSDEAIEEMKRQGEKYADDDKKKRALIEVRNNADQFLHQMKSSFDEHKSKLSPADASKIEEDFKALQDSVDEQNSSSEEIKAKLNALKQSTMKIGDAVYKQQQHKSDETGKSTAQSSDSEGESKSDKSEHVDAEYEETDKKK